MGIGDFVRDRVRERVKEKVKERIEDSPLGDMITRGIEVAARRSDNALQPADVAIVKEHVKEEIAANPVAASQIGGEPWYQNRVKVGLYIVGGGALLKLAGIDFGLSDEDVANLTTGIVAFGAAIAAVGEWFARFLAGIKWKSPLTIGIAAVAVLGFGSAFFWL